MLCGGVQPVGNLSISQEGVKIFLSAGEASGDLYASYLAKALKEELRGARIWGMGGPNMARAGVSLLIYSVHKGAIGVAEALKVLPFFLNAYSRIKDFLSQNVPDVLILVDFGAFNLRLGKWAKGRGIPVLYFIPPGSWKREIGKNVCHLKKSADKVVCIFPWNQKALEEKKLEAYFFGHPLLDILEKEEKPKARAKLSLPEAPTLGFLPGSRQQEIRYILPTLLQVVPLLKKRIPQLQFVVAPPESSFKFLGNCLPSDWEMSSNFLRNGEYIVYVRAGQAWDVINASDALVVTSGTATLEAVILETPLIIIYRGSFLTHLEYHLRGLRLPFISLPNIILGRREFPELIQEDATPPLLASFSCQLLTDERIRNKQFQLFREIQQSLGEKGIFKKTALLVKEMVTKRR